MNYSGFNSKSLELIILPTEKCNFRCTYCYEDFKIGKMPERVVKGIENLILDRITSLDDLSINWFGGEPLLSRKIVLRLAQHAKLLCDQYGAIFSSGVTTNGFLLDLEYLNELVNCGVISYQISIDGPPHIHNKNRPSRLKEPTYERIVGNLTEAYNSNLEFNINLRVHFTPENWVEISRWVNEFAGNFRGDKRFQFSFKCVGRWGGKNDSDTKLFSKENKLEATKTLYAAVGQSFSPFSPEKDGYVCYAAKPNSLLLRADGRIGKCTVALNDKRNDIGRFNDEGNMVINQEVARKWFEGYKTENKAQLACPYSFIGA